MCFYSSLTTTGNIPMTSVSPLAIESKCLSQVTNFPSSCLPRLQCFFYITAIARILETCYYATAKSSLNFDSVITMRWPFLLIGLLFKPPLTTASPFSWYTGGETHSLQVRQAPDCNDLGATFFQACYGILNIGAYLDNPVTGWNHTTPTCNDLEDGANCCLVGEPWTTCYLRLAHGQAGYDCSEINPQSCSYNPQMAVNPIIAPEVRYTMKNIYGK